LPYVKGTIAEIVRDATTLAGEGNRRRRHHAERRRRLSADSPAEMKKFAASHRLPSTISYDESQRPSAPMARLHAGLFGFDKNSACATAAADAVKGTTPVPGGGRELLAAMRQIAATGEGRADQNPASAARSSGIGPPELTEHRSEAADTAGASSSLRPRRPWSRRRLVIPTPAA